MSLFQQILKRNPAAVMGIINVTPDSFSDGGKFFSLAEALKQGLELASQGADILDVGGESTRPGAVEVSCEEEISRVVPLITELSRKIELPLSIDTRKARVAEAAIKAGAKIINDITGLTSPEMLEVAARYQASVVIMHMQGTPGDMQVNPVYQDVVGEVKDFLKTQAGLAKKAGIIDIALDPGIGFGKTMEHNLAILNRLGEFKSLGYPLLIGVSRKAFLGRLTGMPVNQRLAGVLSAVALALYQGADIFRVHEVEPVAQALKVALAIRRGHG